MTETQVSEGYIGSRYPSGEVYVGVIRDGAVVHPLPHIERHSPDGFEWGYGGSGPADLALSILAYHLHLSDSSIDRLPPALYQQFKSDVIAPLPRDHNWEISRLAVNQWLDAHGVGDLFGQRDRNGF